MTLNNSSYSRPRSRFVQRVDWATHLMPRSAQKRARSLAKAFEAGFQAVLYPLFGNPGWLNPRTAVSYIRLRHSRVPYRQAVAFDSLLRMDSFHKSIGAVSVLNAGTLLGAVRQGAFAGRPGDIDLYAVYEHGVDSYLAEFRECSSLFRIVEARHKSTADGPAKLKFRAPIGIDVKVLAHDPISAGFLNPARVLTHDNTPVVWPGIASALTACVFSATFYIPNNFEELLVQYYGNSWKVPSARQFAKRHSVSLSTKRSA